MSWPISSISACNEALYFQCNGEVQRIRCELIGFLERYYSNLHASSTLVQNQMLHMSLYFNSAPFKLFYPFTMSPRCFCRWFKLKPQKHALGVYFTLKCYYERTLGDNSDCCRLYISRNYTAWIEMNKYSLSFFIIPEIIVWFEMYEFSLFLI